MSITRQKAGTTGWSLAGQTADGQMETIPTNRTDAKIKIFVQIRTSKVDGSKCPDRNNQEAA